MSPSSGGRHNPVRLPITTYVRCPSCYSRIGSQPGDDPAEVIYTHGLSGMCSARIPEKPRKERKSRLDRLMGEWDAANL